MGEVIFWVLMCWAIVFSMENTDQYIIGEKSLVIIKGCQEKLPRDDVCELTAVPAQVKYDQAK